MEKIYIGSPHNFHHMEGNTTINFRRAFDLNGIQNDEMLRLYLRKAGLSDEIERLTGEQRRAFIYDIIKSQKLPGQWVPSTIQNPILGNPPIRISASTEFEDAPPAQHPILLKTTVVGPNGNPLEISSPFNYQHTAGDMDRDMTHKAFNLSSPTSDNVLRKYMIERGITNEDIAGMCKADVVRKIVQSKFTWMPPKADRSYNNNKSSDSCSTGNVLLNFANISYFPPENRSSSPTAVDDYKPNLSNFELVTSRFADVIKFPSPEEINLINTHLKTEKNSISLPPLPSLPAETELPPAPPQRKSPSSGSSLQKEKMKKVSKSSKSKRNGEIDNLVDGEGDVEEDEVASSKNSTKFLSIKLSAAIELPGLATKTKTSKRSQKDKEIVVSYESENDSVSISSTSTAKSAKTKTKKHKSKSKKNDSTKHDENERYKSQKSGQKSAIIGEAKTRQGQIRRYPIFLEELKYTQSRKFNNDHDDWIESDEESQ